MYKISSELLIKVTKAIDRAMKDHINTETAKRGVPVPFSKALVKLNEVNEEIKEKYDLTGYNK